jgi:hypothetical protein
MLVTTTVTPPAAVVTPIVCPLTVALEKVYVVPFEFLRRSELI